VLCSQELVGEKGGIAGHAGGICYDCIAMAMSIFQLHEPEQFERAVETARGGSLKRALDQSATDATAD